MTPERWRHVTEVFHAALARDGPARARYLDHACAADHALREEVDAMLAAHGTAARFGVTTATASAARMPRLESGMMIGPYRIDHLIGAGGMGEVYRARDTKLGRDVAIKVLPAAFTADSERLARLEREARLLAALNHPHIAAIHGLEEAGGVRALVLELVEGETLADRVERGPLPVGEALAIARQLGDALDAAHEHGIIHRDLKPANITVTADGNVKVLDFGLAKAFAGIGDGSDLSQSPTVTATAALEGALLGTPGYMSPEQARGKPVDKRTDIWAFGCVLYELLTGRPAFPGETLSDTIAAVLDREPDFRVLPAGTPPVIRKLLRRCLAKERRERLPDIGVARMEIVEALTAPEPSSAAQPLSVAPVRFWQRPLPLTAAIVAAIVATGFTVWTFTRPTPPHVVRLTITPSGANALGISGDAPDLAISPDGTRVVYVGTGGTLVMRHLDQLASIVLGRLSDPRAPSFSPDGQWISFFNGSAALMKLAATGGSPMTVTPITAGAAGASWGADDTLIFATADSSTGLFRVAAGGGEPEILTTPNRDRGERDHWLPEVLPGGQAVLFTILTGDSIDSDQIAVLDLTTRQHKVLIRGGSHARYVPTGHLVYGVAGTIWAVAFDLERLEVLGTPAPVLEQAGTNAFGIANMSISGSGILVHVPGTVQASSSARTLVWVDRQGREVPINMRPLAYRYPRLSPDGARVAVEAVIDIWILDVARETLTRFTLDPARDQYPVWTPDGQRVLFRSERSLAANIFWQAADGTGDVERLTESPSEQAPYSISPDGTRLVFREDARATGQDLKVLMLSGDRRIESLVQTVFNELNAEISPDGRWLAYQSNESGQDEIYVRPFPDANSGRWQISTGGGRTPAWARSGKELFYRATDGALLGVTVAVATGATFRATTPVRLVEGRYFAGGGTANAGRTYDVSRDGQRFLMVKEPPADATSGPREIVVVQNWFEELKRLVPRN